MNRKLVYVCSLAGFFLVWGLFGFAAGVPRSPTALQVTGPPESTSAPLETIAAEVPVTGEPEPVLMEILVFYGLIGLTALFLTLALLKLANRTAISSVQPESHAHKPNNE